MTSSKFFKEQQKNRYYKTLFNLLLLPIFSALNVLTFFSSQSYFLFSSYFSTQLLYAGWVLGQQTGMQEFPIIFSRLAIVAVLPFVACYLVARLSKKPLVSMIATVAGLVLTTADTVLLLVDCVAFLAADPEYFIMNLPDLAAHLAILGIMIYTTVLSVGLYRASRLPDETAEDVAEVSEGVTEDTASTATRTLTLTRRKSFWASGVQLIVLANGEPVCTLKSGATEEIQVSTGKVEITLTTMDASPRMEVPTVTLEEGDAPRAFTADVKTGFLYPKLSLTEEA